LRPTINPSLSLKSKTPQYDATAAYEKYITITEEGDEIPNNEGHGGPRREWIAIPKAVAA